MTEKQVLKNELLFSKLWTFEKVVDAEVQDPNYGHN